MANGEASYTIISWPLLNKTTTPMAQDKIFILPLLVLPSLIQVSPPIGGEQKSQSQVMASALLSYILLKEADQPRRALPNFGSWS